MTIRRPVERVAAVLREPQRYPAFVLGLLRVEPVGTPVGAIGDRYAIELDGGRITVGATVEITAWGERQVRWSGVEGLRHELAWVLTPVGDHTRVRLRFGLELAGPLRGIVERFALHAARRYAIASLEALRHHCEHGPPLG